MMVLTIAGALVITATPSWFAKCSAVHPAPCDFLQDQCPTISRWRCHSLNHSDLVRMLKARGLNPRQQDAVLARRNFIAVAPLFLLQTHAAMQRSGLRVNLSPSYGAPRDPGAFPASKTHFSPWQRLQRRQRPC